MDVIIELKSNQTLPLKAIQIDKDQEFNIKNEQSINLRLDYLNGHIFFQSSGIVQELNNKYNSTVPEIGLTDLF